MTSTATTAAERLEELQENIGQAREGIETLRAQRQRALLAGDDAEVDRIEAEINRQEREAERLTMRQGAAARAAEAERRKAQAAEAARLTREANAQLEDTLAKLERAGELARELEALRQDLDPAAVIRWRLTARKALDAGADLDDIRRPPRRLSFEGVMGTARRLSGFVAEMSQQAVLLTRPSRS